MPSFRDRLRKLQLTQLSQIEVASPCSAPWEEMEGDEKVRFCSQCQLHVFNLSAMDVEEAGARIAEHADGLCVRFFRRADGTLLTRDCPIGVGRKQRSRRLAIRTSVELVVAAAISTVVGMTLLPTHYAVAGAVAPPMTRQLAKRIACSSRDLDRLRTLLEADRDADATAPDGRTLLMDAAEAGWSEAVTLLLKYNPDLSARDRDGMTALDLAVAQKRWKIATQLKQAGGTR